MHSLVKTRLVVEAHEASPGKMKRKGLAWQHEVQGVVKYDRNGVGVLRLLGLFSLQSRKVFFGRDGPSSNRPMPFVCFRQRR